MFHRDIFTYRYNVGCSKRVGMFKPAAPVQQEQSTKKPGPKKPGEKNKEWVSKIYKR